METWDNGTLTNVKKIPLLTVRRAQPDAALASPHSDALPARYALAHATATRGHNG
jgi:hypothetical protein